MTELSLTGNDATGFSWEPVMAHQHPASMNSIGIDQRKWEIGYQHVLQAPNIVMWEASAISWQFTYVGPEAEKLFGFPVYRWYEEDFWVRHLFDDDRERALDFCVRHSQTDDHYEFEYRMYKADGHLAWIHDVVSVVREEGRPVSLRGYLINITARKWLEEALRKSENRFLLAVQGSNAGIWDWDIQGNQVYYSPIWKQMLGYDDSEIADTFEEWENRIHPDDRDRVQNTLKNYLQGHSPDYEAEYRLRHKDHTYRWVLSRGICVRNDKGQATRMAGSHVDITGLKATREALAKSEQALHQRTMLLMKLSESLEQVFWFTELDPVRVIYVNQAFERIWGLSAEALYREPRLWLSRVLEEDQKRTADAFDAFVSGQASCYCVEYRIQRPDGTTCWIQDEGTRMTDDAGRVRWISGIAKDISQSKKAEEALRESEGRFRLMADAAPTLMWMSGPDKGCVYFNKGWLNFTGRSIDQELGNGWAESVHPDDVQACVQVYSEAFDARKDFTVEYRLRRSDGEYRWLLDTGVPRFSDAREFAGYIGSCADITDWKRAQLAIHDMSQRLMSAQEIERTGIARELHDDIGQRLALLSVRLDQVTTRATRWTKKDRCLVENLRQQVKDISSDIQHISHQLHPSKLSLLGLPATVRSFCRQMQTNGKLHIDYVTHDVPSTLPKEMALGLYRVVQEAVANILKHSGASHARVMLTGAPDTLALTISDSGVGFDTDARRGKDGLGLISMQERVHLLGGSMRIRSEPSQGTCVDVRVPLVSPMPGSIE